MKFKNATEKIEWCIKDIHEFIDLIKINNIENEIFSRYELCKAISGQKIINRIENLIVACWSSKDWIIKDIIEKTGKHSALNFEKELYNYDSVQLIQYLADSIKHGGIGQNYLKQNKFIHIKPTLGKTFLQMFNSKVPGRLKFGRMIVGNTVPPFKMDNVCSWVNGQWYFNIDTIFLSVQILDNENNVIFDAMNLVRDYVEIITTLYLKHTNE